MNDLTGRVQTLESTDYVTTDVLNNSINESIEKALNFVDGVAIIDSGKITDLNKN